MWVRHIVINFFQMWATSCFFPSMSSTFTDKNTPCFRWTSKHSQFGFFPTQVLKTPSNCLSHYNLASGGCPYDFLSRSTTRSSMFAQAGPSDSGILSNLGASSKFTWVWGDPAPAACPSQSVNLAITSIDYFCGSHLGRTWALFSKNCTGSRVVFHNATLGVRHDL